MAPTRNSLGHRAALLGSPALLHFSLFGATLGIRALIVWIAGGWDPLRDRSARWGPAHRAMRTAVVLVLVGASAGVGSQEPPETQPANIPAQAASNQPPAKAPDADEIVRQLAARSTNWIMPPAALKTLEYRLFFGPTATAIKVTRGELRREGVWLGATLQAGFRELLRAPANFQVDVKREEGGKYLTLRVKPKDEQRPIRIEIGNGVENSWSGYLSRSAREVTIVVDAKRLVPLEEQIGSTTIRYADWQETGADKWIPRQIDVNDSDIHYRMHFAWLGDAVWLLRLSESIRPEGTVVLTRTRDVKVNGQEVAAPPTNAEQRSQSAARELIAMLDHNRPWLEGGPTGSGWRPPFRTLSYTFHTVREDVREDCVLSQAGEAVFEVAHDGLGKMKSGLGDRRIALKTAESAVAKRGARFARVFGRPEREQRRGQPYDLALKQYARLGCQLDLPLFRYRDQLDFATVTIEDGTRAGQPCRVATVSNLHGTHLGYGTMLAFSSWSYMHDIVPAKEIIEIDPVRNVPIHETLVSSRDNRTFEIDYRDFVEVEPGQWAPRSIRIEANDGLTCEYRFQLVAGTHWMLEEVISWFKAEDKSRGVVEHVRIDGGQKLLDEALKQVETTRTLFDGAGEADRRVNVATVPFSLGHPIRSGPYEIRVTSGAKRTVVVSATTNDRNASDTLPLAFLDEKQRLLFAATVTLTDQDGTKRGSVSLRSSQPWQSVRSIAVPSGDADSMRQPLSVIPIRWGEPFAVNIPDAKEGEVASYGTKSPRDALTRAWQVRLDRTAEGTAKLALDVVSIDGPQEFYLDLAVSLLSESGELLSCGQLATSLKVVSEPTEQRFEIDLGKLRSGTQPKYVAIGIAPGERISAPMGSLWGMFAHPISPFEISTLLTAPDEQSRRIGLDRLDDLRMERSIHAEFTRDPFSNPQRRDEPSLRLTQLRRHTKALVGILEGHDAADVKADAARLLAYSEAEGAAGILEPLAADQAPEVRETVATGLTFLGKSNHITTLRSILERKPPTREKNNDAELAAAKSFDRLEQDALIALAHQRSDAAVDQLGETLLADLETLRPVADDKGQIRLEGRVSRALVINSLLGRTGNPRAVRWLIAAADLIARRPDLAKHFARNELVRSMLQFKEQTNNRIAAELATGDAADVWAHAVRESRDPDFLKPIRTMLRRKDVTANATYSGILYLWNLDTPEALDGLREAYESGLLRNDDPHLWLRLCEALAARGDGRGLGDAFQVLVDLERPIEPPAEEELRRNWQNARNDWLREAEAVFGRSSNELLTEFALRKAETTTPQERRVVLRLLWRLPEFPKPLAAVLPQWTKDADPQVAEQAKRLLDRN
ncbi:hypothetical protein V5E97_23615 [Singulisphaera sp. Ch08]|uniref:HEAT repeat domain-containing protein n=1 Tax=Singulisphaera sp. Ch08 TaxID=3120278 RepID=A0AAU7C987_9BACT